MISILSASHHFTSARSATFKPSTPLLNLMIPAHSPHHNAGSDGQPCPPVPASFYGHPPIEAIHTPPPSSSSSIARFLCLLGRSWRCRQGVPPCNQMMRHDICLPISKGHSPIGGR
jgi:hypothetical protein